LFIENDEILLTRRYPQYILNLERKMKRGVYDREKAVKLFMYLADEASKRYSKQFGDGKTHTADVPTRMLLAKMLRDRFEEERRAMGIPAGRMPRMNPAMFVRTKTDLENLRKQMNKGMIVQEVSYTRNGYRVLLGEARPYERIVSGESFDEYAARAFPRVVKKNPSCGVNMNPVGRTKTWKLGENGGNIKALVNRSGNAVQIIHSDAPIKDGGLDLESGRYGKLFRWPMDKFNMEMYLNDLTTSYYASKIIEWVESVTKGTSMNPVAPAGYHYMPDGRLMADSAHRMNPPALFSKAGFGIIVEDPRTKTLDVVKTFDPKRMDSPMAFDSKKDAENYARRNLDDLQWSVIPITSVLKNPPLSSHGSSIRIKRTHGLSLAEMRALYKLVKQGNDMAIAYASKKLEVPRSASKSDLLAVVDHHIRDLADR